MNVAINKHLLPIKLHYFLFWGGLSGSMPFLAVIAKGLGISATAVALMSSLYPFVALITKPAFGALADYLKRLKLITVATLLFTVITTLVIVFIPAISHKSLSVYSVLLSSLQGYEIGIPRNVADSCLANDVTVQGFNVSASCHLCKKPQHYLGSDYSNISSADLDCVGESLQVLFMLGNISGQSERNLWFPVRDFVVNNNSFLVSDEQFFSCEIMFESEIINHCNSASAQDIYSTYQFWMFLVFFIFSRTGMSILISLSDSVCFEMLGGRYDLYGQQRMWGAIGWGVFSLIGGYLLTLTSHDDFSPAIYMMAVLLLIDCIAVNMAKAESTRFSERILKDLAILLSKVQVLVFLCAVFFMGFLTGIQWTYFFWFLYTFGASKLLLSLILVVQCFLGELPSFFIAGKLIGKIGYQNALSLSFLIFGIRYLAYSYVHNPWYVLPVELCQGPTFGIFYSAMAMYAKSVAIPGTEASMQGLMGGTFEGLGVAVGSLVSGVTLDLVGGHQMFRYASIVAFICSFLHFLVHFFFKKLHTMPFQERPVNDHAEETNFL